MPDTRLASALGEATLDLVHAHPELAREPRLEHRAQRLRRTLWTADVVAICLAFVGLQAATSSSVGNLTVLAYAGLAAAGVAAWFAIASAHDLYRVDDWHSDFGAADELGRLLQVTTLWSWSVLLIAWVTGVLDTVSIGGIALVWVLGVALLLAGRTAARGWCRRQLWFWQNAIVVGTTAEAVPLVRRIARNPKLGINVVACVDLTQRNRFEPQRKRFVDHVPLIGGEPPVTEIVEMLGVDRVILAGSVPGGDESALLAAWRELDVQIDVIPGWLERIGAGKLQTFGGMPVYALPRDGLNRPALAIKRCLDIVVSLAALIVLSPVLAVCALAIKLDSPGPIFFRQRRYGRDDRLFEVVKFRSMYSDAEERKAKVAMLNFHGGGNASGMFKIRHDPRITRVGAFLRRASLDELPQLINVLRGEMSLVGPRPLIEAEHKQIDGRFRRRVRLTPGLTGLWQVHGRSDIPFDEMVRLDYLYASTWSLRLDAALLVRTVGAVVQGRGAY